MLFVRTPTVLLPRFALGVAEAGFWPGLIYYFALWFPPSHRGRAVSRFYVASPVASLVMGAVSGGLLGWRAGCRGWVNWGWALHGWQWLFLAQGLPSVAMGLAFLGCCPIRPKAWTG
jgi:ACS family tartrate transporter-like MFS transporter